jgi:hypothetical protein
MFSICRNFSSKTTEIILSTKLQTKVAQPNRGIKWLKNNTIEWDSRTAAEPEYEFGKESNVRKDPVKGSKCLWTIDDHTQLLLLDQDNS